MKERMEDAEGEAAVLAKIDELSEPDRTTARRIHEIVRTSAPGLVHVWAAIGTSA